MRLLLLNPKKIKSYHQHTIRFTCLRDFKNTTDAQIYEINSIPVRKTHFF